MFFVEIGHTRFLAAMTPRSQPRALIGTTRLSGLSGVSLSRARETFRHIARAATLMPPFNLSASNACVGCPSIEHHEVGNVDDVVDGANADALDLRAQPCGLGPTFTLSILRAEKNGHSRVALIVTPVFLIAIFDSRGVDLSSAGQRRQFRRQTEMAQQIATVRRDLDVENRVAREQIGLARQFLLRATNQKAEASRRGELDWAASILPIRRRAVCFFESHFRSGATLPPATRAEFVANFVVGRTANNWRLWAAVIDFANSQTISIRMARRRGDLRNDYVVDLRAVRLDVSVSPSASQ